MSTPKDSGRDGNDGKCHLLRTPPEVRIVIWELVLGNRHVTVKHRTDGGLKVFTYARDAAFNKEENLWCEVVTWTSLNHWGRTHNPEKNPREYLCIDLLRTCKQIYNETRAIVFRKNNFVFSGMHHFRGLCNMLSREQRGWVREVTVVERHWAMDGRLVQSLSVWQTNRENYVFPLFNPLKVHFVIYTALNKVSPVIRASFGPTKLSLATMNFESCKEMFHNFAFNNSATEYSVSVDCESSLLPHCRVVYAETCKDDVTLKERLGVTEEDKQLFVDKFKKTIA